MISEHPQANRGDRRLKTTVLPARHGGAVLLEMRALPSATRTGLGPRDRLPTEQSRSSVTGSS